MRHLLLVVVVLFAGLWPASASAQWGAGPWRGGYGFNNWGGSYVNYYVYSPEIGGGISGGYVAGYGRPWGFGSLSGWGFGGFGRPAYAPTYSPTYVYAPTYNYAPSYAPSSTPTPAYQRPARPAFRPKFTPTNSYWPSIGGF
ncbi:MAG: hypothetical protein JNG90_06645 [Planctomycetaceae bacterium]|nr:hypothetical protein [Planctomycetaceae bacterium]